MLALTIDQFETFKQVCEQLRRWEHAEKECPRAPDVLDESKLDRLHALILLMCKLDINRYFAGIVTLSQTSTMNNIAEAIPRMESQESMISVVDAALPNRNHAEYIHNFCRCTEIYKILQYGRAFEAFGWRSTNLITYKIFRWVADMP
jgi:hypothetical protein